MRTALALIQPLVVLLMTGEQCSFMCLALILIMQIFIISTFYKFFSLFSVLKLGFCPLVITLCLSLLEMEAT